MGLAPTAVALVLGLGFDPLDQDARRPLIHREDRFAGAAVCQPCHLEQHASWARTFHRTMTQVATSDSVVGAFDGRRVSYAGRSARPFRRDGRFFMEVPDGDGAAREAEVALAVGSRRYQQYFERVEHESGFDFSRLPILSQHHLHGSRRSPLGCPSRALERQLHLLSQHGSEAR
jgi:hypothetical protein